MKRQVDWHLHTKQVHYRGRFKEPENMIFNTAPKGIREPHPGESIDGMPVVYVGGHHRVVCDGEWHHRYTDESAYPPDMIFQKIVQCSGWVGGCPAKPPGLDSR